MAEQAAAQQVLARIDDWRRRLVDLSFRNRLINYRPTKSSTLEIRQPSIYELLRDPDRAEPFDFYFPPEPDPESEEGGREEPKPPPEPRPGDLVTQIEDRKRFERILENLARRSNAEFQDKGLRILHLAVGFLHWTDPVRKEELKSPLVLVPVELQRESARHPYRLRIAEDDEIVINPALTIKLEKDAGVAVPEDWVWEDKPLHDELNEIRDAIFDTSWRVEETAVLSLFSFQKLVMYRDLLANEDRVAEHPLIQALATDSVDVATHDAFDAVPSEAELDSAQDPKASFAILDSDASQRRCLEAAARGCSFVMHGPPGTGKSQTIANVIAEAIGHGKKVLFISEKLAALDVVFKRLSQRGLGEFCLKLHGRDAGRREVVEALYESLVSKTQPNAGLTDRELERLRDVRNELNEVVQLLHRPQADLLDRTPRDVYATLAALESAPLLSAVPKATTTISSEASRELADLEASFQAAAEQWAVGSDPDLPWRGYRHTTFDSERRAELLDSLGVLSARAMDMLDRGEAVAQGLGLPAPQSQRAALELIELGRLLHMSPTIGPDLLGAGAAERAAQALADASSAHRDLEEATQRLRVHYHHRETDSFPRDLETQIGTALDELGSLIGRSSDWEAGLLPNIAGLARFVEQAPASLADLDTDARALAAHLGQPSSPLTVTAVDDLAELAELAYSASSRPDRRWLVKAGLESARKALDDLEPLVTQCANAADQIESQYSASVYQLDLPALEARLQAVEGRRLAKLSGSHRSDLKLLRATRLDGRVPATPLEDVRLVRGTITLRERLEAESERSADVLGGWADIARTDVDQVRKAMSTAERAIALISPDADLDALATSLCLGARPDADALQVASALRSKANELRAGCSVLESLSALESTPPFEEAALSAVRVRLEAVDQPLRSIQRAARALQEDRSSPIVSLSEFETQAHLVANAQRAAAVVSAQRSSWQADLGVRYLGAETAWETVEAEVGSAASIANHLDGEVPAQLRTLLANRDSDRPGISALSDAVDAFESALKGLLAHFDDSRAADLGQAATSQTVEDLLALIDGLVGSVDRLGELSDLNRAAARAASSGWGEFVRDLQAHGVEPEVVLPAFRRAFWIGRLEKLADAHPELRDFRGRAHERLIAEFNDLDQRLLQAGTDRIIGACNSARPAPVALGNSQVGTLMKEAKKKRRHMPVRRLLRELPTILPQLKPCLMMSPLTVSHYLSPDHHFDLVIFDEASQVPPWDAVNCIYRGDQLVVAGDSKQLPPTPFFQLADPEGTEYDEEAVAEEVMESILDSCTTVLPGESLRWHYRSRHEHLIAFSNHNFYSNRLVTFPAPVLDADELGVHFCKVDDGVYDRARSRQNRVEARRVAERVVHHLRTHPGRSVGVVAFSVAQSNAILDELEALRERNPDLEHHFTEDRLDGVFVKNLESVQGDERDVIVFSLGYGRDEHGKFTMSFGPLNSDGGHRRLNVAITRAREQVDVVASVSASDFKLSETAAPGARLLQSYLEFAELGPGALRSEIESMGGEYESPFEEAVAEAVREMGYEVIPQVGVGGFRIDLGVVDPSASGRFALGIECDGATYHSTPTARDRDRLRQDILERLGWRIHRIWSWDWVRERRREVARLREAIRRAVEDRVERDFGGEQAPTLNQPIDSEPERRREVIDVPELRGPDDALSLDWVRRYEVADLAGFWEHYDFHEPANRKVLLKALDKLLSIEAPVHVDYAIKRMAEAQGVMRRGSRVVATGRAVIQLAAGRGALERRDDFLWLPDQTLATVRVPDSDERLTRRTISEIPPEEVELALVMLLRAGAPRDTKALVTHVARLFGFERTGSTIQSKLGDRLEALIARATEESPEDS